MHQHCRFLQVLWIVLLLTISSIQIVSVRGLGGLGNTNMLLRIRTNEGTFQIRGLDETTTKVQELVTAPPMHLYNLLEPGFSLDPMGKQVLLDYDQPLSYYQLQHGSMIYVRVEKKTKGLPAAATTSTTTITRDSDSIDPLSFYNSQVPSVASKPSKPAGSSSTIAAAAASNDGKRKEQPVIDLLDSESDSDNGGDSSGGQQSINLLESSDDDDSVKIVQPTAAPPRTKSKIIKNPYAKPPKTTTTTTTTTNAAKSKPKSAPSSSIASSSHSSLPDTFQVASYNVWFGPPDPTANQVHYAQRMKAIAQALFQCHQQPITNPLLAIGFQELTPSLKQSLFPLLSHQDYQVCSQPSLDDAHGGGSSYGVGLALHQKSCGTILESKFIPFFHSQQGRGILYARTSRGLLFCTTHLESYTGPQSDGAQARQAQLLEWQAFCRQHEQNNQNQAASSNNKPLTTMVLVGDLNWDDERARGGAAPNAPLLSLLNGDNNNNNNNNNNNSNNDGCWKDAWKEAGSPKAHQYTYDAKENPMLGGNLRRRFDRCVWQSKSHTVTQWETIGRQALPNLVWNKRNMFNGTSKQVPVAPSDHFGMVVTFSKKK